MRKRCALAASPQPTLSSAMHYDWPRISGFQRISGLMSQLIGPGCNSATVSSGRWPPSSAQGLSRTSLRAYDPERTGQAPNFRYGCPPAAAERAARGGTAMDDKGRESGHLMLITPERVFYAGLLGRPRERCPGAFHVYGAIKGALHLSTSEGGEARGELAVTMPNLRHTITSEYRSAICVAIEPESVRDGTLEMITRRLQ